MITTEQTPVKPSMRARVGGNDPDQHSSNRFPQNVNDLHSQLNPTRIAKVVDVKRVDDVIRAVRRAKRNGQSISIAGGRHAMGGQQFGTDTILLDMRGLNRILNFDAKEGTIEVEAGIEWPDLMRGYLTLQNGRAEQWGINQKQTGADRLSIGGAIAANIHGRGLTMRPFVQDLLSLLLVDAEGELRRCSRTENPQLFRLVVGGYGLFGVVVQATLQLVPRQKIERIVEMQTIDMLLPAFEERIEAGYSYGDFQFAIDPASDEFLREGVFSCYRPTESHRPIPKEQKRLSKQDWELLLTLAHTDKAAAYRYFVDFYLATTGQLYWSDTLQLSIYLDDYHRKLDEHLYAIGHTQRCERASEVITELYVPRDRLRDFMAAVRDDFRQYDVDLVYGTVRLIERDDESFLAWAKEAYACVIFNLHTLHNAEGIAHSAATFRRLIDMAIAQGGSYFLTYHRYATREQVLACYPNFIEFLRLKRTYDPEERFQSDWYRHYRELFG